jgi:hypothetical protein
MNRSLLFHHELALLFLSLLLSLSLSLSGLLMAVSMPDRTVNVNAEWRKLEGYAVVRK